jgi:hypothetical protein
MLFAVDEIGDETLESGEHENVRLGRAASPSSYRDESAPFKAAAGSFARESACQAGHLRFFSIRR